MKNQQPTTNRTTHTATEPRTATTTHHNYLVIETTNRYYKEHRKTYPSKPQTTTAQIITIEEYKKRLEWESILKTFGTYRKQYSYTIFGYTPTTITTTPKDHSEKVTYKYQFEYLSLYHAINQAGYREKNILNNLISFDIRYESNRKIYTFYHFDGEHQAEWDDTFEKWIG